MKKVLKFILYILTIFVFCATIQVLSDLSVVVAQILSDVAHDLGYIGGTSIFFNSTKTIFWLCLALVLGKDLIYPSKITSIQFFQNLYKEIKITDLLLSMFLLVGLCFRSYKLRGDLECLFNTKISYE